MARGSRLEHDLRDGASGRPVRAARGHNLLDLSHETYLHAGYKVALDALSVAAPVRGPGKEIVAALSIVVRAGRASPPALAPLVVAAARAISRAIVSPAIRHLGPAALPGPSSAPRQ